MHISLDIFEQILYEHGIPRHSVREIIEQYKSTIAEKSEDIQKYMTHLLVQAVQEGIKPSKGDTISELEATKILGKCPAFFRVARVQNRLTPRSLKFGKNYRYTFHDLAEYLAKINSYK